MDFWSKEFSGANIATEGLHRILEGLCGYLTSHKKSVV